MNAPAKNRAPLQNPLIMLGVYINRSVTVIQQRSGEFVIHTVNPCAKQDLCPSTMGRVRGAGRGTGELNQTFLLLAPTLC